MILSAANIPVLLCLLALTPAAFPQDSNAGASSDDVSASTAETGGDTSDIPASVSVESVAEDADIERRLERILNATGWFETPRVRVEEGVVFLTGRVDESEHSQWAAKLAGATEDVVAVVNRLQVAEPPLWNITPAVTVLRGLARDTIQALPMMAIAILILILTWFATVITLRICDATILKRIESNLLREVSRKALAVPVIVLGLYLVLMVSGLSRLAVTVIGGTGLFGLVLGVAFRDIMENFLSSILISMQNPFKYGDLVEVDGHKGFVHRVNTRGTLLMTLDGNHLQIPNSTIYKNVIKNYTSNPNVRFDFIVGIGYDASATRAQELTMDVLHDHPAVLNHPEPMVLVDQLASATINIKVYFWVDGHKHSGFKVKSSVIRQVMRRLEAAGISMPDDAREVVFPADVPVRMLPETASTDAALDASQGNRRPHRPAEHSDDEQVSNVAEGDFVSEAGEIHEQGRRARDPEDDASDLLDGSADGESQRSESAVPAGASA